MKRINCVTIHLHGVETYIGPAKTFAQIKGNTKMVENSDPWPPEGSALEAKMHEAAIGFASLLGAAFTCGTHKTPHWTNHAWTYFRADGKPCANNYHQTQGAAAVAYLAHQRGYWLAYNKQDDSWELVRI